MVRVLLQMSLSSDGLEGWKIYLNIDIRYVTNNVVLVVDNGQGGDAFIVHQYKGFLEGPIAAVESDASAMRGHRRGKKHVLDRN